MQTRSLPDPKNFSAACFKIRPPVRILRTSRMDWRFRRRTNFISCTSFSMQRAVYADESVLDAGVG